MACQYSEIFGRVGEGAHSYRIFNIAVVDVVLTVLLGLSVQWLIMPKTSLVVILAVLFIVGIVLHRVFCVRTTIDRLIFPNTDA
jgi:tetrahydromethanopterin S-methyltransferase subunit E